MNVVPVKSTDLIPLIENSTPGSTMVADVVENPTVEPLHCAVSVVTAPPKTVFQQAPTLLPSRSANVGIAKRPRTAKSRMYLLISTTPLVLQRKVSWKAFTLEYLSGLVASSRYGVDSRMPSEEASTKPQWYV